MTIRVVLADDQALIRAGFKALIDSAPDLTVVAEAATGAEAVTLARSSRADIVLMDIRMPDMDGITATRAITTDDDMAGVRVVILTTFEIDDLVDPGRSRPEPAGSSAKASTPLNSSTRSASSPPARHCSPRERRAVSWPSSATTSGQPPDDRIRTSSTASPHANASSRRSSPLDSATTTSPNASTSHRSP